MACKVMDSALATPDKRGVYIFGRSCTHRRHSFDSPVTIDVVGWQFRIGGFALWDECISNDDELLYLDTRATMTHKTPSTHLQYNTRYGRIATLFTHCPLLSCADTDAWTLTHAEVLTIHV